MLEKDPTAVLPVRISSSAGDRFAYVSMEIRSHFNFILCTNQEKSSWKLLQINFLDPPYMSRWKKASLFNEKRKHAQESKQEREISIAALHLEERSCKYIAAMLP